MDMSYLAMVVAMTIFLLFKLLKKKDNTSEIEAPEPAGCWPILGHIPILASATPTHQMMSALADRYGPAITLRLGQKRALLISNWELAKECLATNDHALAGRPNTMSGRHVGYNFASFALATNCPHWRDTRKIVVHEFLSGRRLESVQHVRTSEEVDMWVKGLYGLWADREDQVLVAVEMKDMFWRLSANVITRMTAGKRLFGPHSDDEEAQEFRHVAGRLLHLLTVPNIGDLLPFLRWFDLQGYERASMETAREMDAIMQKWMDEHSLYTDGNAGHSENRDFFDVLLSMREAGNLPNYYSADTFIKATMLILIIAGTETTSIELTWALSLLVNNRHVLKKAQAELDKQVGQERVVRPSDIRKLPYLKAIVKETLRLYPVGPLLVPHEATKDCTVGGFYVRAGTHLLVNAWKIHRDPRMWSDPLEFHPERFLEQHVEMDVWGHDFQLIPFGSGRRSCVGSILAVQVMELALARLLHGFDWSTPFDGPVDMSEGFAFSLLKLKPLQLLFSPRLPPTLYE